MNTVSNFPPVTGSPIQEGVKVSVIVPVYNGERYLGRCLDSILNQTLREIEVICINDGSTDRTSAILHEYARRDPRIVAIDQINLGVAETRNHALSLASGEYIQFVDSDDWIVNEACEHLYEQAKQQRLDMLSFAGNNFLHLTGELLDDPYHNFRYLPDDWTPIVFNARTFGPFLHQMAVSTCLTIYRRSFLACHGLQFPVGLRYEDSLFFTQALFLAERMSIDRPVYYFRRIHGHQITSNYHRFFADKIAVVDLIPMHLQKIGVGQAVFDAFRKTYVEENLRTFRIFAFRYRQKYLASLISFLEKYGYSANAIDRHAYLEWFFDTKRSRGGRIVSSHGILLYQVSRKGMSRH